jgi:aminoglycoside phosphotransferase (APT) family kinase protein
MPINQQPDINIELVRKVIAEQFPEYMDLPITAVEKQGHDNRTYRLGDNMLIRMPTDESYALKVPIEQNILPQLAPQLTVTIPVPIKMGVPSHSYPYPFSIYKWIPGTNLSSITLNDNHLEKLAIDLAKFLKELQGINNINGPMPGQHNWWRGAHISFYNEGAREQIGKLSKLIDTSKAIDLWEQACRTVWNNPPVWIHGDFAADNILIKDNSLSAVIDFGGMGLGDPACDFVIAWTFFRGRPRENFIKEISLDQDTWLRAKAWALWKATFELCQITEENNPNAFIQKKIIEEVTA